MLWFLFLAAKRGFVVDRYLDEAVGVLGLDADGRLTMTRVTLRPAVTFSGARTPDAAHIRELHAAAHDECFIARSVRTEVACEPVL
jgi:organic hydroperoxide reductase OsmC/OhrA